MRNRKGVENLNQAVRVVCMVWGLYWAVEYTFTALIPWLLAPSHLYRPLNWQFTLLLLGLYQIMALLNALLLWRLGRWICSHDLTRIWFQGGSSLTLTIAVTITLAIQSTPLSRVRDSLTISVFTLLGLAILWELFKQAKLPKVTFFCNSFLIVPILIGLPWALNHWFQSGESQYGSKSAPTELFGLTVLVLLAAMAFSWMSSRILQFIRAQHPMLGRLVACSLITVIGASAFLLDQKPLLNPVSNKQPVQANRSRPNIIMITLDTVRADHMSLYGYHRKTTPNLELLAREATLYRNVLASGPFTLPTHASLFTGLYASWHGAHFFPPNFANGRPLAGRFTTLAEMLSALGYRTAGIASNSGFLSPNFGLAQGFEYYDNRIPVPFLGRTDHFLLRQGVRNLLTVFDSPVNFDQRARRANEINQEISPLLEQLQQEEQPFFLFVNYMDAHWPYIPPAPFDTLYPGKDESFTESDFLSLVGDVLAFKRKVTPRERNHIVSQYDGGIQYLDHHLHQLFEKLKSLDLYSDSLIIVTSDHGEAFGERDLMEHGVSVYQDQVQIPLIIKYPSQTRGEQVDQFVSVVDILPTIREMLGFEEDPSLHGLSLLKPQELPPDRVLLSESYPRGFLYFWNNRRLVRLERAVVKNGFKYIKSTSGKREFYDLRNDPLETKNLFESHPQQAALWDAQLIDWIKSRPVGKSGETQLDKETLERLRSLGYLN